MAPYIYFLLIILSTLSDAANMICDEDALSELQLELSVLRQEISELRQNYSLIQTELKQTEDLNDAQEKTQGERGIDVEEEIRRLKHAIRLLNEAINSYDDFIKNLEAPVEEALKRAAEHDGYTCENDYPADVRIESEIDKFKDGTMANAAKLQMQIRDMFSAINKGLKEELVHA